MKTRSCPVSRGGTALAALAALIALASCSEDADDAPEADVTPTSSPRVPSGDNGELTDPVGARDELMKFECEADRGAWSASGRLRNRTAKPVTYLVRVSLADGDAGTVLGTAEKSVTVDAKDSVRVAFDEFHAGDRKGSCVARVVKSS